MKKSNILTAFIIALITGLVCFFLLLALEINLSAKEVKYGIDWSTDEPVPVMVLAPQKEKPIIDPDDLEALAIVIFQEAGGDECCDDCRRMVADVVLNRVADKRYPNTIQAVLIQKAQYGRLYWTGLVWPKRASLEEEAYAVERAYRIAEEVLSGDHSDLYGNGYIYQAEFKQSDDNVECHGTYFGR